jgi:periplasmic divalent cation tolerance protein
MEENYAVVNTTIGTEAEAVALARSIVEARLAGCVQMLPIHSVYRWQGEVRTGAEWLLSIKTVERRYAELEQHIRANHTYETPEIVRVAIAGGSREYLDWIDECVG